MKTKKAKTKHILDLNGREKIKNFFWNSGVYLTVFYFAAAFLVVIIQQIFATNVDYFWNQEFLFIFCWVFLLIFLLFLFFKYGKIIFLLLIKKKFLTSNFDLTKKALCRKKIFLLIFIILQLGLWGFTFYGSYWGFSFWPTFHFPSYFLITSIPLIVWLGYGVPFVMEKAKESFNFVQKSLNKLSHEKSINEKNCAIALYSQNKVLQWVFLTGFYCTIAALIIVCGLVVFFTQNNITLTMGTWKKRIFWGVLFVGLVLLLFSLVKIGQKSLIWWKYKQNKQNCLKLQNEIFGQGNNVFSLWLSLCVAMGIILVLLINESGKEFLTKNNIWEKIKNFTFNDYQDLRKYQLPEITIIAIWKFVSLRIILIVFGSFIIFWTFWYAIWAIQKIGKWIKENQILDKFVKLFV